MKRFIALIAIFLVASLGSGCRTLADAQAAKGTGSFRVYDKPYDAVWNAVIETVKSSGLALVSESKEKGSILAQRGISVVSVGENVAIYVEDAGGKTRVEVISKRAVATQWLAPNWETRILEALDKRL